MLGLQGLREFSLQEFLCCCPLYHLQDVQFFDFKPTAERPPEAPGPTLRFFKTVKGRDIFLYSAIANSREPADGEVNIIITAFDSTGTDSLQCCVLTKGDKLYTTQAVVFYKYYIEDILSSVLELFKNAPTKAKQYACVLPELGFQASHVTLTSSSCPSTLEEYLPVLQPQVVPGGLALCAKVRPPVSRPRLLLPLQSLSRTHEERMKLKPGQPLIPIC